MSKSHYGEPPSEKKAKKFQKFLSEDEEMMLMTGFSPMYLYNKFSLYLMILLAVALPLGAGASIFFKLQMATTLVIACLIALILAYIKTYFVKEGTHYILTNKRVVVQKGYFSISLGSAPYNKISHIEIEQSFIDRFLFKHGELIIHTAGSNSKEVTINSIDEPVEFKNILEGLIHRERSEYSNLSS